LVAITVFAIAGAAPAQVGPPVTPGFPNVAQIPGEILSGLNAPQQGRTAIIAYHNGVLFTVPEVPASQPGADFRVRSWNISNPSNPVQIADWGVTPMPINAHGYLHSGDYLVLGANWPPGGEWSFRATAPLTVQRAAFPDLDCAGVRGCLFQPWFVGDTFWSYNAVGGDAWISLRWNELARWDHLGLTGVIGHPFLLGDLLIFASDQSRTGVATYDVSDPTDPILLDVLTTGGPGGYWPELWGYDGRLYIVFPYQTEGNGFRVVDATDPANLRFIADRPLSGVESMYIQFQDEFAFMGSHKVDMRTFESVVFFDPDVERPNQPGVFGVNTSQFLLPLGNLVATGGIGEDEGMAIWAHQVAPDTRGPSVGYHIPQAGRTNYPTNLPISLLIHETLESPTIVNGVTFIVRPLGGSAVAGRLTLAFDDVLTFTPNAALQANTTYEVVIPEGGIKDAAGNGVAGYSFTFSTGSSLGGNRPPAVTSFTASSYPVAPGALLTLSAAASDPDNNPLQYRFDFGDGSPKTAWSSTPSSAASYASAGHYRATVQVRDTSGSIASDTLTVTVLDPPAGPRPSNSSPVVCDTGARRVWVVNPDSDTLTAIDADTLAVELEVPVCEDPRGAALSAAGEVWIACHDGDAIQVVGGAGAVVTTIPTGYGSAPAAIAIAPNGATAYATLSGSGALARFDTAARQPTGTLALGPKPRAIAVSGNGARILVTRFLSPMNHAEVWDVNASTFTLTRTIQIPKFGGNENFDTTAAGRGVANYLAGIAIAPDGASAWVAANKPNSERGLLTSGDLDQDNTVRNLALQIDLTTNALARAIDIDNSDSASAVGFSPLGDYLLITLQGNNELAVFDTLVSAGSSGLGSFVSRIATGLAPQGVCSDAATNRVVVSNFMSRSLTALEADGLFRLGELTIPAADVQTVGAEPLPAAVLAGKQIFYSAGDTRMSAEGYMSCATCHVDGGDDGRTWDFTGRGEGLRNTVTLRGRGGMTQGNVHWTANFDEIQDFENDIRAAFGGTGFLSDPDFAATQNPLGPSKTGLSAGLDDLAAYVGSLDHGSLPRSPWRGAAGAMTAAALAGEVVFDGLDCASCHSGPEYTDSSIGAATLHDVGTLRTTSGERLGGPLGGIDTPTLLGIWDTAPYFHDGSAATLDDVFSVAGGIVLAAEDGAPSNGAGVVNQWIEYNNDDTVRGRAYVAFGSTGARLRFSNVHGGAGGQGAVEVRYSSGYSVQPLNVAINGVTRSVNLPLLGNEPGWRHVNWGWVRVEDVQLNAGTTNTIDLVSPGSFPNISVDEIVVTRSDERAAAAPHRQVLALPSADRANLHAYLLQLDGRAPSGGPPPTGTSPPTATPANTASHTATRTASQTATRTASQTPTRTATRTPTRTPSSTPTRTTSRTPSQTPTGSPTRTPTPTPTTSPTPTPTVALLGVSGRILYDGSEVPVNAALVEGSGAAQISDMTDSSGSYALDQLVPGAWTVQPRKLGDSRDAVDSMDALIALETSAGLRALAAPRQLACDVTGNGSVSALDASLILQFSVAQIAQLPAATRCNSDFLFAPAMAAGGGVTAVEPVSGPAECVPGAVVFDPLSASMNSQDFTAVAFGDCSGDWQPSGGGGARRVRATGEEITIGPLRRRDADLVLPIRLAPGTSFRAMDLELRYDAARLRARRAELTGAARTALSRVNLADAGRVRLALARLEALVSDQRPLLVVHFEARGHHAARGKVRLTRMKIDGVDRTP
jgi:YVTN family beta-propeller protein